MSDDVPGTLAESIRRKITGEQSSKSVPKEIVPESGRDCNELVLQKARAIGDQIFKETTWSDVDEILMQKVNARIKELVDKVGIPLSVADSSSLLERVRDEVFGFGPLGPLLRDPTVDSICVNGPASVFVQRHGRHERTNIFFEDNKHIMSTIEKMIAPFGLQLDEKNPIVTARLPSGSRVEVACPPVSPDGPIISIVCASSKISSLGQMVEKLVMSPPMAGLLKAYISNKRNIIVSGSPATNKNILVGALSARFDWAERLISVEPVAEMRLLKEHWIRLELPQCAEQKNEMTLRALVAKALRMLPDRIVVGECSGDEVIELLDAFGTGSVSGIMTINASSPADCLRRIESMFRSVDPSYLRETIVSGIHAIVHLQRMPDGTDRISEIAEVIGIKDNKINTATVCRLDTGGGAAPTWSQPANPRHVSSLEPHSSLIEIDYNPIDYPPES